MVHVTDTVVLPETAVDLESLRILAANGIRFTIMAPRQAHRTRALKGRHHWKEVSGELVDPSTPYTIPLGNDQSIAVFFSRSLAEAVQEEHAVAVLARRDLEHLFGVGCASAPRLALRRTRELHRIGDNLGEHVRHQTPDPLTTTPTVFAKM